MADEKEACEHCDGVERRYYNAVLRCRPCVEIAFRKTHPDANREQLNNCWKNASDSNRASRKKYKKKLSLKRAERTSQLEGRVTELEQQLATVGPKPTKSKESPSAELEMALERASAAESARDKATEAFRQHAVQLNAEKATMREQLSQLTQQRELTLKDLAAARLQASKDVSAAKKDVDNTKNQASRDLASAKLQTNKEVAALQAEVAAAKSKARVDVGRLLLNDRAYADVSLTCVDGVVVTAHRAVLAARSDFFRDVIGVNTLVPVHAPSDLLEPVLAFIYTGEIDDSVVGQRAADLFAVAEEFRLDDLRAACDRACARDLAIDTFKATVLLADLHKTAALLETCFVFAKSHAAKLLVRADVMQLAVDRPHLWTALADFVSGHTPFQPPASWQQPDDRPTTARASKRPRVPASDHHAKLQRT